MPYVYVEPDIYLEHKGVRVFHVYDDDGPYKYWFTTDPETADHSYGHGQEGHFDVRRFVGRWPGTPTVQEWEDYWKPRFKTEDDAMIALIEEAINAEKVRAQTDG